MNMHQAHLAEPVKSISRKIENPLLVLLVGLGPKLPPPVQSRIEMPIEDLQRRPSALAEAPLPRETPHWVELPMWAACQKLPPRGKGERSQAGKPKAPNALCLDLWPDQWEGCLWQLRNPSFAMTADLRIYSAKWHLFAQQFCQDLG